MPARRINFTCQPNPLPLLQRDLATAAKIQANVPNLRRYGINSDVIVVGWGAALVCLQGFQGKQCPSRASSACLRHASCTCAAQNGMQRLGHARLRPGRRRHSGLDSGATMSLPPPPPPAGALPPRQPVLVLRPLVGHHPAAVICHCRGAAAAGSAGCQRVVARRPPPGAQGKPQHQPSGPAAVGGGMRGVCELGRGLLLSQARY